ncbi:MAG TPA: M20/M25/M40 family metallo-hydrolase [Candidatus Nanopelagicales bacterium]|nr:M20/M25/M40 family metallo-hydrolase [Candidatus Nanopelagicales bacterium]
MTTKLNLKDASASADRAWEQEIVPALCDYIRIPNKSPAFDPAWREHGHMDRATELIASWCRAQRLPGLTVEVVRLEGRTPVILMEIPGAPGAHGNDDTVLLYGHLDKQPEMAGWREDLGPWEPVREGDRLYGRGGADDGYSAFASLLALRLLAEQGIPHARCVILIEACEESGSFDLPAYVDALADRFGRPSLIVCLDSGCGNYDQLWTTTSLRGLIQGTLEVRILREGVHSGGASGIAASSFRILRQLLSRIEDPETGRILVDALHVQIPEARVAQAAAAAAVLGNGVYEELPFVPGARPMADDPKELLLNRTWRPALSVTGADGLPPIESAGNVLRPFTRAKLSMRIPPRLAPREAAAALKAALEKDPPYGAQVTFKVSEPSAGWDAPALAPWLEASMHAASEAFFGKPAMAFGEGGTIPFMGMLGEKFPEAQFLITGVLGPQSNAHGPNEFLHIGVGKRLTCCVASVLADHHAR